MSKTECRDETIKVLIIFTLWIAMAWGIAAILKWGGLLCQ